MVFIERGKAQMHVISDCNVTFTFYFYLFTPLAMTR